MKILKKSFFITNNNQTQTKLYHISSFNITKFSRERIANKYNEKLIKKKEETQNPTRKEEKKIVLIKKDKEKTLFSPTDAFRRWKEMNLTDEIRNNRSVNMVVQVQLYKNLLIRGVRECPGGKNKTPKVCVFTSQAYEEVAINAGADKVANMQTYEDIKNKKIEYDLYICSMEVLPQVKLLGRILGPIGLMPNPKLGTAVLGEKLEEAILSYKSGNREFKSDKEGYIRLTLGRFAFGEESLMKNMIAFLKELERKRSENVKSKYIKSAWLSLGGVKESFKIDPLSLDLKSSTFHVENI